MRWATLGRGRLYFLLLTLPAVLYVFVWRIAPAFYTVWLSFTQYNIIYDPGPQWNHLENYRRLLQDGGLGEALRLSAVFAISATAMELLIGLGAAAFFDSDPPGRNLLLGIFLLPMIMAPVVVGTVWSALFDPTVGPVMYLFERVGVPEFQWLSKPLTAFMGLVVAMLSVTGVIIWWRKRASRVTVAQKRQRGILVAEQAQPRMPLPER